MQKLRKKHLEINILFFTLILFSVKASGQLPVISNFSPASGMIGSTVIVNGSNYSPIAANNIVYFGDVKAEVSFATANSLSVTVPNGATPQPISVTTNNLTAYSSKPFVITFAGGSASIISSSFTKAADVSTGLHPYGICAVDIDGDGKPDLITPNNANSPSPSTISVLRNVGNPSAPAFATGMALAAPPGSYPYNIVAADIDGDGKLDLIFTSILSNTVSVYRNTSIPGTLSFATRIDFTTGTNPFSVAYGDLDGDGKPDLAVANFLSNSISLFENTSSPGTISFSAKVDIATSLAPHTVVIGDMDGDGKPDLAVANTFSSTISLFRNKSSIGNLTFAAKSDIATGPDEPFGLALADLDGDGKPDLALTNDNFNSVNQASISLSLFKNNSSVGNISFAAPSNYGTGDAYNPSIGDLNGDGKPDIVIPSSNTSLIIYANASTPGSIILNNPTNYFDPSPYAVTMTDLDGDSLPDLAVANFNSNTITLFQNATKTAGISRFFPVIAAAGARDTIIGANLSGATSVSFGGLPASSFTVVSDTFIVAMVGAGVSGDISVSTPKGTATLSGFTFAGIPVITSFAPYYGTGAGFPVTITGANLTGATAVLFGGVPARAFSVNSPTTITAIVDQGATGDITITTPGGTADIPGFKYIGPSIGSFLPASGTAGTVVTITGNYFFSISAVNFGGVPAASFTVVSSSTIQAVVGIGASGNVSVINSNGTVNSPGFTYTGPTISSVVPSYGGLGAKIVVKGANFTGASSVTFGGTSAASFLVVDTATIEAIVGSGSSGTINIVTPLGVATSPGFAFTTYPVITSFSPSSGSVGTTVTIGGANFSTDPSTDAVFFGAVKAVITSANANEMVVTVPTGTTPEPIKIITQGQIAAARNPFIVTFSGAGPVLSSKSFDGQFNFTVGASPQGIVICDFDGDGKPDLAAGCVSRVSILRNTSANGFLSFASRIDLPGTYMPQHLAAGDIDGDGKLDLIVADYSTSGGLVSIYKNMSTAGVIAFASKIDLTLSGAARVFVQDMDGDGKADLIVADLFPANNIAILHNTSSGGIISFAPPIFFSSPSGGGGELAIADLDGDGKPDVAVLAGPWVTIIKNTSMPGFIAMQEPGMILPAGYDPIDITVADLDGDGKPDLAVADAGGGEESVHIYPNTSTVGAISFGGTINVQAPANSGSWRVTVNDMDGDGKPDLVVTNSNTMSVSVYKSACSPGNFSFASNVDYKTGNFPWLSTTGDLDGDGKPDIVVSHNDGYDTVPNTVTVLKNRTGLRSDMPSILINGSPVICQGDSITLSSSTAVNNQWYKDGQAIAGATNLTLSVIASGVYAVSTLYPGNASLLSAGDTITVNPVPARPTITHDPTQGLMSSSNVGNQWYKDTTAVISGATGQVYKPTESGYYSVQVEENGCRSPFSAKYNYITTAVINVGGANQYVQIAPNPASSFLSITYNLSGIYALDVEMSDLNGREVITNTNLHNGDTVDISGLARGMYFVRIRTHDGKITVATQFIKL